MNKFASFNQFDKRFQEFEKFGSDRTACPLFALITSYNFMQNGEISKQRHESNICASVTNYMTRDIPKYMLFEELIQMTNGNLKESDINATTPEMISQNIVGYEHIFKFGHPENYCLIVLKNRNYIVIMVKNTDENQSYSIRDCHENFQYDFNNFEECQNFLDKTYQFEQMTIVDGFPIPEFSNIEFITIDHKFELVNIDPDLVDENIVDDTNYEEPIINDHINKIDKVDFEKEFALALQMEDNDEYKMYIPI
jgi:hypothetical protein